MTTLSKLPLKKGSVLVGKWKGQQYRIESLLGEGANGKVFLVSKDWNWYALKIGADAIDLQSEINALKALAERNLSQNDNYLKDVDDCIMPDGKEYSFYTMRYVKGQDIPTYLEQNGQEWFPLLALNILRRLGQLHQAGWIFGDLKVENIIIAEYGHVELIDYGGATKIGKSVKQFTEIYDRGYWNSGTRCADSAYDLFSFATLCVQLFAPRKLAQATSDLIPQNRSIEELMSIVKSIPQLAHYEGWLLKAFHGQFRHGEEAAEAWRMLAHRRKAIVKSNKTPRWLKVLITVSLLSLCTVASIALLELGGLLK